MFRESSGRDSNWDRALWSMRERNRVRRVTFAFIGGGLVCGVIWTYECASCVLNIGRRLKGRGFCLEEL